MPGSNPDMNHLGHPRRRALPRVQRGGSSATAATMKTSAVFLLACHLLMVCVTGFQPVASGWQGFQRRRPMNSKEVVRSSCLSDMRCSEDSTQSRKMQPAPQKYDLQPKLQLALRSDSDGGMRLSRRTLLFAAGCVGVSQSAWAQSAVVQKGDPLPEGAQTPSAEQIRVVQQGIEAFNNKELEKAEKLFNSSIEVWESLKRPRDEKAELYKFRANVRVDLKRFEDALEDYNTVLGLMSDGEKGDGTARYMEYPDTYVQRGLCYEGLYRWDDAVKDYDRAVKLWGGGRGQGVNPYVLTFRANALGQLGRYKESLIDYKAAEEKFLQRRDQERALDSRANYALALFETGERQEAYKIMQEIVRRRQGYTDMHVALAAVEWGEGRRDDAENQWETACDRISTGCRKYKDLEWVKVVRRWPPTMVSLLASFLDMKASEPPIKIPLPSLPVLGDPSKDSPAPAP